MARVSLDGRRWLRRGAIALGIVVLLFVVVDLAAFLAAPVLVKSIAEKQITEQLGRKATIGKIAFDPLRLAATVDDFTLYEPDGTTPAITVAELEANVSSASLWRRALVFDSLRVVRPTIRVTRLAPQRYSFSDVIDRLAAKPKSDSTFHYSINNIELTGGAIDVDDRVTARKHRVDDLHLGLPFVSNLPYDADIYVTPSFGATIDGSTVAITGKAQPFSTTREAAMAFDVTDLDLTEYIALSPVKLGFALASGKLSTKLSLTFKAASQDEAGRTVPQSLVVAGHVTVAALDLTTLDKRRAIAAKAIDVELTKVDPINGIYALREVAIAAPEVVATRRADGSVDLVELFRLPPSNAAPAPPSPSSAASTSPTASSGSAGVTTTTTTTTTTKDAPPAATFTLATFRLADGRVRIVDETLTKAATTNLDDVDLEAHAIALRGTTPTTFKVAIRGEGGVTLAADGSTILEQRTITGSLALKGFEPARVAPYLAAMLAARIDSGSVNADARYRIDASGATPTGVIDGIAVRIEHLKTSLPDEKTALVAADAIALEGGRFDLATRTFSADALALTAPAVAIRRDAKGRINLRAALVEARPVAQAPDAATRGAAVEVQPVAARPFTAVVKTLSIERGDVAFDDLAVPAPVHVRIQPLNVKVENLGTDEKAVVPFMLDAAIDKHGKLALKGRATVAPLDVDATIDANRVAVGWLAAYAGDRLNVVLDSADLNLKGGLQVTQAKTAKAAPNIRYRGSFGIANLRALDRATSDEFVRWKLLNVPTVDLRVPADAPLSVTLGTVALDDFYARLIVNTTGRLNLEDVVASPGRQQSVTRPEDATPADQAGTDASNDVSTASTTTDTTPPSPPPQPNVAPAATKPAPVAAGAKPVIHVAGVKLTNGRIGITDNFIKPNYSADLTALVGEVSAIASDDPRPATLKLDGRIDGDGVIHVDGNLDPLAPKRYTDIRAEAKDIELTRLTPYAVKYAGYPIERGKLSSKVEYHIENEQLQAKNQLFLDQLTFGEHAADAKANLPVRLAVALLKNSRGEINIELPVSGSLSNPQFSIGGVLWRALLNLLARAVTSPFALIGSAFGGGSGGELGYIQFAPGVSDLTPQGKTKLETLAKALAERPALKLDIIGRYDPASDAEGLRKDHLLDRMKDLKAKDLSKGGDRVGRDAVTIDPGDDYAKYLAAAYDNTKLPDKPRNVIGLAKSVPAPEMETRLLADIKLAPDDPLWLAQARADVVRHYLEDTGKIAPGRVFLVTPKLNADGIKDQGAPNRVDFAIR